MKTILLGMTNPLSSRPEHALWPSPPGCTGHRIYEMIRSRLPDVTEKSYRDAFDRRNLVTGGWSAARGRAAAERLIEEMADSGRTIVVLGDAVRRCLDLPRAPLSTTPLRGAAWVQLPHPSGLNRWYNDEKNRKKVAIMLARLYAREEALL